MIKKLIQNTSVKVKIFSAIVLMLIFMIFYNIFTFKRLSEIKENLVQTQNYIFSYNKDISTIQHDLNNVLLRFYIFTRQKISYPDFYNFYQNKSEEISSLINSLENRVESYQEYVLLNKFKSSYKLFDDISQEVIRAYKLSDTRGIEKSLVSLNEIYGNVTSELKKFRDFVLEKQRARFDVLSFAIKRIERALLIVDIILILGGLIFVFMMYSSFLSEFLKIIDKSKVMAEGNIPEPLDISITGEIGELGGNINKIIETHRTLYEILENLKKERYQDIMHEDIDTKDILVTSVLQLAQQLEKTKKEQLKREEQEKNRRWITEGLNLFSDVMRQTSNDLQLLGDAVIKNLVKYLEASVGGLYILEDADPDDVHLKLLSVFAYDRKKFYTKRIELGEGLIGSVAVDRTMLYLKNIPEDYIEIESGLGDARPNNLLIVPLKTDRGLHGVFEIAAFKEFQQYELEFAESVAQSIAATIEAVKVNARTVQLLQETQQKSEELAKREQELRRLYDQMQAARQEAEARAAEMSSILNAVSQVLLRVEIDPEGAVITANDSFLRTLKVSRGQVLGESFKFVLPQQQENLDQIILKKLRALQIYKDTFHYKVGDRDVWLLVTFAPVLGPSDELIRILWLSIDITEQKEIELRNAKLLEESMKKSEELMRAHQVVKRNEIELKSILEGIDQTLLRAEYSVEGILLFANEKHRKTLGYNYEEVLGKSIFIFIPEEEKEDFAKLWKEVASGALKQVQVKRKTATGQDIWLLNQYTPIRDEQGNITKILYLAVDVTEQVEAEQKAKHALEEAQRAQKELQEKEAELRSILEGIDRAILRAEYTPEGILTFANELHRNTFGYNYEEVLGKSIFIFIPEEEKEEFAKLWQEVASGQMKQVRVRRFTVTGEELWLLNQYTPVIDPVSGKVTKILYLAQNITEQVRAELEAKQALEETQKAQQELAEKEAELRSILEGIDRAILRAEYTPEGILTYANQLHRDTFGYNYEEVLGKSIFIFIPEEEKEEFQKLWQEVAAGQMKQVRVRRFTATGEELWLLNQYTPVIDPHTGKVTKILYLAQNITEQVRAELEAKQALERAKRQEQQLRAFQEVLRKAEAERRAILEGIDRVILRAEYSPEGALLFANELHRKTLGYNYEEALGKSIMNFIPEEDKEDFLKIWEKVRKGEVIQIRVKRYTADGKEIWLLNQYTPVVDDQGNIYKILYLAQDITAQVHAEQEAKRALKEALKEQAEAIRLQKESDFYRARVENILAAIDAVVYRISFNLDGTVFDISDRFKELIGIQEITDISIKDILSEKLLPVFEAAFEKVKQGEYVKERFPFETPKGKKFWFLSQFAPIYEEDKLVRILVLNVDITDQVEKEEYINRLLQEITHREIEQRAIISAIDSTMIRAETDTNGVIKTINKRYIELLGYDSEDQIIGTSVFDFVPQENKEHFRQLWNKIISGNAFQQTTLRRNLKTGEEVWLLSQYTPVADEQGNIQKIIYLGVDITEQKKLEKQIIMREQELMFFRKGVDSVLLRAEYTPEGILIDANELHQKTIGYQLEQMRGKSILEFVPEHDRENFLKIWEKVKNGQHYHVVVQRERQDTGEILWLLNQYIPVKDDSGKVVRVIYLAIDITEQKTMEAQFSALLSGLDKQILRAVYAPDGTLLDANKLHQQLLGYDIEQMRGKNILEFVPEEERDEFQKMWNKIASGKYLSKTVLRYRQDTGQPIWLLNQYIPIIDTKGNITQIFYLATDITHERQTEIELTRVMNGLDKWFLRAEYTPEGNLLRANDLHQKVIGYKLEDKVGHSILEFVSQEEHENFRRNVWEKVTSGEFIQIIAQRYRQDTGQTIWLMNHYFPIRDDRENIVMVVYLAIDITRFQQVVQNLEYLLQGVDSTMLRAEYDAQGNLLDANQMHQRIIGYKLEDYLGKNILEFVPEDQQKDFLENIWNKVISGQSLQIAVKRERQDTGQQIWLLNQYIPIKDRGQVVRVIYLAMDITAQKQLEQYLTSLLSGIDQKVLRAVYSPDGTLLDANQLHQRIIGYDIEQMRGKNILEFVPETEHERFSRMWQKIAAGEYTSIEAHRYRQDTGEEIWLLNQYIPIKDDAGNVIQIIYLASDITEQKKRQAEVERIMQGLDEWFLEAEYTPEGILLKANENHQKVIGYKLEDFIGKSILEFISEEQHEEFMNNIWNKVKQGELIQLVVQRYREDTGEKIWLLNHYLPIKDTDGNVIRILYLAIDITKYQGSVELLQDILKGVDATLLRAEYDADGKLLDANDLHQKVIGYKLQDHLGKSIFEFVPESERIEFQKIWQRVVAGEQYQVVVRRKRKDTGKDIWLLNQYIPILGEAGKVVKVIYLAIDITTQKTLEAYLNSLIKGIDQKLLRAVYQPDGRLMDANQLHQQIIGYDIKDMRGKSILEFVPEEEREQFQQMWNEISEGQYKSITALRYRKDTGEPIWLLNQYLPVKNEAGNVIQIIYLAIDITEEKEKEQELQRLLAGLDQWFMKAEYTPAGELLDANENHQLVMGYNIKEWKGKNILEFIPENEREKFISEIWSKVQKGELVKVIVQRYRADTGESIWLLNHYLPIKDEKGEIERIVYLAIDITEFQGSVEALEYLMQGVDATLLRAEYDADGKLLSANKLHQEIIGYNIDQYIGKSILEFVPEEEREEFEKQIWQKVISGKPHQVVVRRLRQDTGEEIWLLNQYIPILGKDGKVVRVIYLATDITEQKRLERRLHYLTLGVDKTLLRAEYTPEGILEDANQLHQKIIGYDLEQFRGKHITEFVPEEEREEFDKIWQKVLSGQTAQLLARRVRKDTNQQIWLLNQYIPIIDQSGKIESIIYLAIDITEYRKFYEQTTELKGEVEALTIAVDATMLRAEYTPDGILLDANERHVKVLGYDLEQMKGKSILEFIPEEEHEDFLKIWEKVKAGEPQQIVVKRKNMETGQDVWLVNQYTPVFDQSGNVKKIIYLAIDITDKAFNDKLANSGSDFDSDIDKDINDWLDDISGS